MINTVTYPAATWLLESNLSYDTDLDQDNHSDGFNPRDGACLFLRLVVVED